MLRNDLLSNFIKKNAYSYKYEDPNIDIIFFMYKITFVIVTRRTLI